MRSKKRYWFVRSKNCSLRQLASSGESGTDVQTCHWHLWITQSSLKIVLPQLLTESCDRDCSCLLAKLVKLLTLWLVRLMKEMLTFQWINVYVLTLQNFWHLNVGNRKPFLSCHIPFINDRHILNRLTQTSESGLWSVKTLMLTVER